MTIQDYVNDILCVPVTRIGNRYIVEAIELVLDTGDHKFYSRLASILSVTPKYLEKAMRDAKTLGLLYMGSDLKEEIFGSDADVATQEYVIRASGYYKKKYK